MTQTRKNRKRIICVQIAVTFILIGFGIFQIASPYEYEPDLSSFISEYVSDKEGIWKYDHKMSLYKAQKGDFLNNGPYIALHPSSYTLDIEYATDAVQNCVISSESGREYVHANSFFLSPNKCKETYHFYTTNEATDLAIRIVYSGNGDFELKHVRITSNLIIFRLLLFAWIVGLILFDTFCYLPYFRQRRMVFFKLAGASLLACLPCLMDGLVMGHDYAFHLIRIESLAKGLQHLQIPVRINDIFNDSYGYPVSIFYGDAFLYIAAVLRIIGFPLLISYKIFLFIISFFTTLSAYLCFRQMSKRRENALMASAAYVASDYRLFDAFLRSALGETIAFIFYPMIVLALWKIYSEDVQKKEYGYNSILLAMGMLGILYSHILSLEMVTTAVLVICILCFHKTLRLRTLAVLFKSAGHFVVGGLAFLVPFLDYYIHCDIELKHNMIRPSMIQKLGVYVSDLFSFYGTVDGVSSTSILNRARLTPGFLLMLGFVMALYLIYRNKYSISLKVFLLSSVVLLFLSSDVFPWDRLEYLGSFGKTLTQIQFPFRYLALASCTLAFLLFVVFNLFVDHKITKQKHLELFFIAAILLTTGSFLSGFTESHNHGTYIDTAELPYYTTSTTNESLPGLGTEEYLLTGTNINALNHVLLTENANAEIIEESPGQIRLHVTAFGNGYVEVPRFNYPYYTAKDPSGKKYPIETGLNNKIRILLKDPMENTLVVRFDEPLPWKLCTWI